MAFRAIVAEASSDIFFPIIINNFALAGEDIKYFAAVFMLVVTNGCPWLQRGMHNTVHFINKHFSYCIFLSTVKIGNSCFLNLSKINQHSNPPYQLLPIGWAIYRYHEQHA